ncbi:hypothetical protein AB6A40_002778 [Gnathostoma spinigerum]|uniref:JNK1/MAPK8-associated membrane protein n=1 Tax=Gnathostoma spinigerum TaxID=75299 RepID=A0ABD6EFE0_9BILA
MVDDGPGSRRFSSTVRACPGFCGRTYTTSYGNSSFSECQACSWGSRSIDKVLCSPCMEPLPLYDWLYLTFVAIIPLLLHSFFIQHYASEKTGRRLQASQFICCFFECALAAFIALLAMPPRGSPILYGCPKNSLREWYPMLFNPVINHTYVLQCSHEIVFPLYSLPFIYFALCFVFLVIFRSILFATYLRHTVVSSKSYYAALYSLPNLAVIHAMMAGVIYYIFAYVALLCSLSLNAVFMALEENKPMRSMCLHMITRPRNLAALLVHMTLFGFSIFTFIVSRSSPSYGVLGLLAVLLVPLPSVFFLLTASFTNPLHVHDPA